MKDLIPKDKGDVETAYRLQNCTYEDVKSIVPLLLKWLQDYNWPVSRPVADFLVTIADEITGELIQILRGNDDVWKYWCLNIFGFTEKTIAPDLIKEIERIVVCPTKGEVEEGVLEIALKIVKEHKKESGRKQ